VTFVAKTRSLALAVALSAACVCASACASSLHPCLADCNSPLPAAFQPDRSVKPDVVTLTPTSGWMDTGIPVHKGDHLLISTKGEVFWQARQLKTGPDGDGGSPGWKVGPGGLCGRVGADGRPFDVGARTTLFPDQHARPPHHPYPAPPIVIAEEGTLYLGFKAFVAGANTGAFEVTIARAIPVAP
jgi:hypothetical protein